MTQLRKPIVFIYWAFVLVLACYCGPARSCTEQAKTALEQVLCQIKTKDPNSTLPSLKEFRRNPALTQSLLLKRPAERLGIELPELEPSTTRQRSSRRSEPSPRAPQQVDIMRPEKSAPASEPKPRALSCRLKGELYICGADIYRLQRNVANTRLPENALTQTQIKLPAAQTRSNSQLRDHYIVNAYRAYIEAMLAIGLAEVTLSFTKFNHLYDDAQQRQIDFSERLETMFEYLKKDKRTMAAGGRAKGHLPQNAAQCERLSSRLVVCDDVVNNWIYAKK